MIKKLRWRFISAAMLAFLLVIALIAGLVNIANYCVETGRIDRTIDSIVNYDAYRPQFAGPDMWGRGPGGPGMAGEMTPMEPFLALPDIEANYMTRFFIVAVDDDNEVLFASMDFVASVDETEAVEYTSTALNRNSDRGYIGGYRYARVDTDDATVVVFLNCENEIRLMNSVLSMTLVISIFALFLVFVLVVILSRKAIQPIAQNIEIQKRFITDAGHELKTPLTSISTSIDVIEMEHGQDEWTDNVRSQVSRMSGLVGELVALSRLDEIKPVPDKEPFDLSGAAWETLEVFIPQAKARGKEIKTDIQENLQLVGEKTSIQQMLSVLLDNAIKYSDDNGQISFSVNKVKNRVKIEVFNTCNYEKVPDTTRLFDRFYRPDESRNSSTGGNGIGLAIAKAVADAHGGRISASCPDGKSMKITVEL